MLFLVEVLTDLLGQLRGEFAEPIARGVKAPELLDEYLSLVVIRHGMATDAESGVVHEQRHVEVALFGGCVRVELVGECQKGHATFVDRCPPVGHRSDKDSLNLMAVAQIIEDRHVARSLLESRVGPRGRCRRQRTASLATRGDGRSRCMALHRVGQRLAAVVSGYLRPMFAFVGSLLFWILVILVLAAVGIAAIGRRAGKDFSQQLREMREALGLSGNRSTSTRADATKAELYEEAKDADVKGRSTMSKDELKTALDDKA